MFYERKVTLARFPSWCNVIDDNVVMLDRKLPYEIYRTLGFTHHAMLFKGKLKQARFPLWCDIFDDNVVVLDRKLPYEN